jgi:transposase
MTTIRHLYHFQKQKIRRIAEEFGLSRNTVRKIVQTEDVGKKYTRTKQVAPRLEPYQEALQGLLETSEKLPRKQQYTARKLYETLRSQGYAGAYDSIQRYVKAWKKRRGKLQNQAYIPCVFAPGEAYQFDWSDETAEIGGIVQRIKVAHVRLCFSRYFLCIAYPNERQEMFFDAHTRAFEHFEGNAGCGIYDNLKTGIKVICIGKEREYNRAFLMMLGHYCIDPRACTPGAGWEKGRVENQVETVRKQLFVPMPRFESFEALNDWLRMRCEQLANTFKHPEQKDKTVAEVFESQEKDQFRRFSVPFDGGVAHTVSVSKTCLVRFDRNCYSVDCHYAGRVVTLKAYADRIVVVADNAIIAEHLRLFGRDQACYRLVALSRCSGKKAWSAQEWRAFQRHGLAASHPTGPDASGQENRRRQGVRQDSASYSDRRTGNCHRRLRTGSGRKNGQRRCHPEPYFQAAAQSCPGCRRNSREAFSQAPASCRLCAL